MPNTVDGMLEQFSYDGEISEEAIEYAGRIAMEIVAERDRQITKWSKTDTNGRRKEREGSWYTGAQRKRVDLNKYNEEGSINNDGAFFDAKHFITRANNGEGSILNRMAELPNIPSDKLSNGEKSLISFGESIGVPVRIIAMKDKAAA